ncbi:hypothetical protein MSG34_06940 [Vibrio sp. 1CM2L]|uniref:hypothetical protein n=1 Tax=Vibrio sp. 1CM2L TaxID=2929166 RepID=UPI0020BFE85C|nr:hypothetical protein [Vibrio sp. 1CM2L]MCK8075886.1 hypothetical protein [Vibrio sp. 1CM2L]
MSNRKNVKIFGLAMVMLASGISTNAAASIEAGDWFQWQGRVPLETVDDIAWKLVPKDTSTPDFTVGERGELEFTNGAGEGEYTLTSASTIGFKLEDIATPGTFATDFTYEVIAADYSIDGSYGQDINGRHFDVIAPGGDSLIHNPQQATSGEGTVTVVAGTESIVANPHDNVVVQAYVEASTITL